jgi:hypothetical protein
MGFLGQERGAFDEANSTERAIMSKQIVSVAGVVLVAGIGGYAAFFAAKSETHPEQAVWTEIQWPFPVDQWGGGWAFQCKAADCGIDVNLYLRPKIGFCNCQTGVADDEELDRVGDVDIIGSERSALGPGRSIAVRAMKGRSRGYTVGTPSAKTVLSVAFNSRCDVVVATVVAAGDPVPQEHAVLEFLNSDLVVQRVEVILGL